MSDKILSPQDILCLKDVSHRTGKSVRTIYREIRAGTFPRPVKISRGRVGVLAADYQRWLQSLTPAPPVVPENECDDFGEYDRTANR